MPGASQQLKRLKQSEQNAPLRSSRTGGTRYAEVSRGVKRFPTINGYMCLPKQKTVVGIKVDPCSCEEKVVTCGATKHHRW